MRNLVLIISLFFSAGVFAQKNVEPITTADANNGILYSLPKTTLEVQVEIKKTIHKAGPYAQYAKEYFGLESSQVVLMDKVTYEITDIRIKRKGIPHPARTYKVTANQNSKASQMLLDERGVIYGVNLSENEREAAFETMNELPPVSDEMIENLLFDKSDLVEGYFFSSPKKMKDVAASQIYLIRESQLNLLMGSAEKMPPDAASLQLMLDELKKRENALMELFTGKSTTVTEYKTYEITPERAMKDRVLIYFSPTIGVTTSVEGITSSYYVSLKINKKGAAPVVTKSNAKNGFYYCEPGSVDIQISNDEKVVLKENVPVAQFGTIMSLPAQYIEKNNAALIFDPSTGALKTKK